MHVLIVDDEAAIRDSLEMILSYERYPVSLASNGREALDTLDHHPIDVVLLDIKMPDRDGLEILETIRGRWPECPVIMISGHGTVQTAVEATKKGAFDFIEKPLDRDRILLTLRNAARQLDLQRQNRALKVQWDSRFEIQAQSPSMLTLLETLDRVALTDARVLITGENGTGKELAARRIHLKSRRHVGPFVDVNCAAIPSELIESELFGHERGAFTGALASTKGKFELADGGTLFLDEVGDMSLGAQAKVLRVLEENVIHRVGGPKAIPVDVRIVAATNKDLPREVQAGSFREDLYYRLNVVPIHVSPLRERLDDVPLLAGHFMVEAAKRHQISQKKLSPGAIQVLQAHDWPGNVRELRNVAERLAILARGDVVSEADVRSLLQRTPSDTEDLYAACETFEEFKERSERLFIEKKLQANNWNIKKTAESLKMQRSHLYKKLEKYNLK